MYQLCPAFINHLLDIGLIGDDRTGTVLAPCHRLFSGTHKHVQGVHQTMDMVAGHQGGDQHIVDTILTGLEHGQYQCCIIEQRILKDFKELQRL